MMLTIGDLIKQLVLIKQFSRRSGFILILNINKIFCKQTEGPDQTPHSAASDLYQHCLPASHKKDASLNIYLLM